MFYSLNDSYPKSIPNRIVLSDGRVRTDSSSFTQEEIEDAGYRYIGMPPEVTYPNVLDWDGTNWITRLPNEIETSRQKENIKQQCLDMLEQTDYIVIKNIEHGLPVPEAYKSARQDLRDIYNNIDNLDPWNVRLPDLEALKESNG